MVWFFGDPYVHFCRSRWSLWSLQVITSVSRDRRATDHSRQKSARKRKIKLQKRAKTVKKKDSMTEYAECYVWDWRRKRNDRLVLLNKRASFYRLWFPCLCIFTDTDISPTFVSIVIAVKLIWLPSFYLKELKESMESDAKSDATAEVAETVDASTQTPPEPQSPPPPPQILIAQVENVIHDKFMITEEVRVSFGLDTLFHYSICYFLQISFS